tara:strand:+ start:410 stop:673 length:264 start_codon:yes stop_codon:yes gene_type:complete
MVKGSVTISIEDYHTLIDSTIEFKNKELKLTTASKEFQVFLSFLASRADLEKYIEEFNKQSKTSRIVFEGTTAKIEIKNNEKDIKEV